MFRVVDGNSPYRGGLSDARYGQWRNKPDGSSNRSTLTFPAGQFPPVKAFWSVTMYDGKTQLLIENPINRCLIKSPILPDLKKNADGSLTIYMQKDSPGADKESNWSPALDGPICVVMRLYGPKEATVDGSWKPPAVQQIKCGCISYSPLRACVGLTTP
jgi:hypothetical protein